MYQLSPSDDAVQANLQKHAGSTVKAKPTKLNALQMAGALDGYARPGTEKETDKSTASAAPIREPPNQKFGLLKALLAVGDLKHAMFFLSKFPKLTSPFPDVADLLLRLMNEIIEPAYAPLSPVAKIAKYRAVAAAAAVPRKRYSITERGLVTPSAVPQVLQGFGLPQHYPNRDWIFFFAEWRDRLPQGDRTARIDVVLQLLRFVGSRANRNPTFLSRLMRIGVAAVHVRH